MAKEDFDTDLKSLQYIEDMIKKHDLSRIPRAINMIEEQFSKYAYLKSLIEMKREGSL